MSYNNFQIISNYKKLNKDENVHRYESKRSREREIDK